jgi:hypothetical protein
VRCGRLEIDQRLNPAVRSMRSSPIRRSSPRVLAQSHELQDQACRDRRAAERGERDASGSMH